MTLEYSTAWSTQSETYAKGNVPSGGEERGGAVVVTCGLKTIKAERNIQKTKVAKQ
jgi:hypothetical protein